MIENAKEKMNLLTWMAVTRDAGGNSGMLKNVYTKLNDNYDLQKVYYLYTPEANSKQQEIKKRLVEAKDGIKNIELIPIKGITDPSKHAQVYESLKKVLDTRKENLGKVCINLSAGTPAMHAVWLLLYAGGYFNAGSKLISPQKITEEDSSYKNSRIDFVDFKIDTYLASVRKFAKSHPEKPIYREPRSPKRKKAFDDILRYANVPEAPLLIMGERGCGKTNFVETWIKSIKKKNVVTIPCGTLDADKFEAKLFGYKKGAYTGAIKDQEGLIEQARNNILFLDEIQDMAPDTQRKLLRVLNEHKYSKFMDTEEIDISFELICATNISIDELKKKLYPDFYDRISMFRVEIPPLRECREDVLDDWMEVWQKIQKGGLSSRFPEGEELECLKRYLETSDLSGNFRSLKRIAYQRLAWGDEKTMQEIIEDTESDNRFVGSNFDQVFRIEDFPEFHELTWNEAKDLFCKKLAKWATAKYKDINTAATKLECNAKTLKNNAL